MSDFFVLTLLAVCVVGLMRNELVYRSRKRRIREISKRNFQAIDAGTYTEDMSDDYERIGNYHLQVLDVRKWRYDHFFKDQA